MHTSFPIRTFFVAVFSYALANTVGAQATMDHSAMGHSSMASAVTSAMTDGEVKKIDIKAQTITLKHSAIKNLNMPAMTMLFKAKMPALIAQVKVGDKVRFKAEMTKEVLTLVAIEPAP
jgi:Cu/Ag efflux protein CusF